MLQSECLGVEEILNNLNDEDLFSVLETVSRRMYSTKNRKEAIGKILSCSESASSVLKRQKITKKILFNYLLEKRVPVSAEWEKSTFVKKCLEYWGSTDIIQENDYDRENTVQSSIETPIHPSSELMGVKFCQWFFHILNTLNGFGPQHFWPTCTLSAQLFSMSGPKDVFITGDNDVALFFVNLIANDKFYFQANDASDSVKLHIEEHGLVQVVIHGILHQYSNCVGLFDSAFGLVKHPDLEDTFKIQVVKMNLKVNRGIVPINY